MGRLRLYRNPWVPLLLLLFSSFALLSSLYGIAQGKTHLWPFLVIQSPMVGFWGHEFVQSSRRQREYRRARPDIHSRASISTFGPDPDSLARAISHATPLQPTPFERAKDSFRTVSDDLADLARGTIRALGAEPAGPGEGERTGSGVVIPDSFVPVIGYREWMIKHDKEGPVLRPRAFDELIFAWRSGENKADCQAGGLGHHVHVVAGEGCTCGFYAYKELSALRRDIAFNLDNYICGCVALYGTVSEHSRGYRASRAVIVNLFKGGIHTRALAERYNVPVVELTDVKRRTRYFM